MIGPISIAKIGCQHCELGPIIFSYMGYFRCRINFLLFQSLAAMTFRRVYLMLRIKFVAFTTKIPPYSTLRTIAHTRFNSIFKHLFLPNQISTKKTTVATANPIPRIGKANAKSFNFITVKPCSFFFFS